jgi:uncharacterized membrane protein
MSAIERSVEVRVPVRTAYNQFTQFEDFPRFMQDVEEVRQLDDTTVRWTARIAGAEREWDADITEQEPDQRIAWRSRGEVDHAGAVTFHRTGEDQTRVMLQMDVEPSDWVEKVGDALNVMERRVEDDLESFKAFIEQRGHETGAWRGEVGQDPTS